jgi:hypothetical protein
MQCPQCDYICFKQSKTCGSCGFNFKKAATSSTALLRNDAFSIFSGSKPSPIDQEETIEEVSVKIHNVGEIDPSEEEQRAQKFGEFLLDLSDAKQEKPFNESTALDSNDTGFTHIKFGTDSDINLEEVEVEGLGLGLEPFDEKEPELEEPVLEISEESSLEIPKPVEETVIDLDFNNLGDSEEIKTMEVVPGAEEAELEIEPSSPVLDLGEEEVAVDNTPDASPSPPVEIEEFDFKLEIDDSDGPLSTTNLEIPEIEIEDLGLELENEDLPTDPEK